MVRRTRFGAWWVGSAVVVGLGGCASDPEAPSRPTRGSIGEELYGVVCDRIGAQALPEDLTGASFRDVCHRDSTGQFALAVDASLLPANVTGVEAATRTHALARIGALVNRREDLIGALDAIFPPRVTLAAHDGPNPDGSPGCAPSGERTLGDELAAMLARMAPAYDDGTVPEMTRAFGRLLQSINDAPDAQSSLAHFGARTGYRPSSLALGAIRPVLAYPGLRDLMRASSKVLSPDSDPYALDSNGQHVAVPGSAYGEVVALNEVASYALRTTTADPTPGLLRTTLDPTIGLARLSRPRTSSEIAASLLSTEDAAFAGQNALDHYLVRRDPRGVVSVATTASGAIPAPFEDVNLDGLADVDALGSLLLADGTVAPSPFVTPWLTDSTLRDFSGRAQRASDQSLLYSYMNTSHTYAAALLRDAIPMVNSNPAALHETLMDGLAGAYVALGPRDGAPLSSRSYALGDGLATTVHYDGFHGELSPLLDLVYAGGQLVADPNADSALATASWLFQAHQPELAQTVSAALAVKAIADAHPEASIPPTSTLWDDVLDVATQITQVKDADGTPGLVSDLLTALSNDATAPLGDALGTLLESSDQVDYNRADMNGPAMNVSTGALGGPLVTAVNRSQPAIGFDRSIFFRFLQLVHDTRGVNVCNRQGATVKALFAGIPVLGDVTISIPDNPLVTTFWGKSSFGQCEVFAIHDMASFYVESIVGQAQYVLRDKQLREGVQIDLGVTTLGVSQTATTVQLLQNSSGITGWQPPGTTDTSLRTGFWTPASSTSLMTRPEWLNRNLFFPNGVPASAPQPSVAETFSKALNPDHAGTSVCPTVAVKDPLDPSDPNYTPGGIINLPACADGDWLDQRDSGTIFALEQNGFYEAIAPLIQPFVTRGRADLLVALLDALYRHWAAPNGDPNECRLTPTTNCTKDGAVTYEPIVAATVRQVLPALRLVAKALVASNAPTPWLACATRDATGACVGKSASPVAGLAATLKGAIDPDESARRGLVDRRGHATATRNDGTTNPQVTPVYLLLEALSSMDGAFATYAAARGGDTTRLVQWRRARSQLVDQLLATTSSNGWQFSDASIPAIAPHAVDTLRQQLYARCAEWPNAACAWAGGLAASASDTVSGPVFAHAVDLLDALRADAPSRVAVENLATYLLGAGSTNDALASFLATSDDLAQVLGDDANIVPLLHAVGATMIPPAGHRSLIDANLALLTRFTAPASDAFGAEQCGREIDPNQVLTLILGTAATPMSSGRTPIEVVMDVIGDVNRAAPESPSAFTAVDYGSIADQVAEFMLDEQRGLEQFYAVVQNATK